MADSTSVSVIIDGPGRELGNFSLSYYVDLGALYLCFEQLRGVFKIYSSMKTSSKRSVGRFRESLQLLKTIQYLRLYIPMSSLSLLPKGPKSKGTLVG